MSTDNTDRPTPQTPRTADGVASTSPEKPVSKTGTAVSGARAGEATATLADEALAPLKNLADKVSQAAGPIPSATAPEPATPVTATTDRADDDTKDHDVDAANVHTQTGGRTTDGPETAAKAADTADDAAEEAAIESSGQEAPASAVSQEPPVGTFPVGRPA